MSVLVDKLKTATMAQMDNVGQLNPATTRASELVANISAVRAGTARLSELNQEELNYESAGNFDIPIITTFVEGYVYNGSGLTSHLQTYSGSINNVYDLTPAGANITANINYRAEDFLMAHFGYQQGPASADWFNSSSYSGYLSGRFPMSCRPMNRSGWTITNNQKITKSPSSTNSYNYPQFCLQWIPIRNNTNKDQKRRKTIASSSNSSNSSYSYLVAYIIQLSDNPLQPFTVTNCGLAKKLSTESDDTAITSNATVTLSAINLESIRANSEAIILLMSPWHYQSTSNNYQGPHLTGIIDSYYSDYRLFDEKQEITGNLEMARKMLSRSITDPSQLFSKSANHAKFRG